MVYIDVLIGVLILMVAMSCIDAITEYDFSRRDGSAIFLWAILLIIAAFRLFSYIKMGV